MREFLPRIIGNFKLFKFFAEDIRIQLNLKRQDKININKSRRKPTFIYILSI